MTETCLPIVQWLKNWFYDKNEIDTELESKSDTGHTHTLSDITDYSTGGLVQKKKQNAGSSTPVTYTLFVDETNRHCSLTIKGNGVGIGTGASNYEISGFVPSQYRSNGTKFSRLVRGNTLLAYMWNDGTVGISNLTSSSSSGVNLNGQMDWNY